VFSNILGKEKKSKNDSKLSELKEKISKMNLTEMRSYVNNKLNNLQVTQEGLVEIIKVLTLENETTGKRYLNIDDMDSKIKKALDLVIVIASSKKVTVALVEWIQQFITLYDDNIIKNFDTQNKQIYSSKLKKALKQAVLNVNSKAILDQKMKTLDFS